MKKLLLTTEEWLHLKWMLERNMIRMDADAFRLKEGEPGSEARREAIGKELERIEKEHRNIERMLEKIEAAETVQTATDETEEKKLAERLGYEPEEETRERQERLLEELRYREAMRRVAKTCCVWLGGAAFVLAVIAGYAEMADACVATGAIALGLTTYGIL